MKKFWMQLPVIVVGVKLDSIPGRLGRLIPVMMNRFAEVVIAGGSLNN